MMYVLGFIYWVSEHLPHLAIIATLCVMVWAVVNWYYTLSNVYELIGYGCLISLTIAVCRLVDRG